jgi:hypothetical protein
LFPNKTEFRIRSGGSPIMFAFCARIPGIDRRPEQVVIKKSDLLETRMENLLRSSAAPLFALYSFAIPNREAGRSEGPKVAGPVVTCHSPADFRSG